MAAYLWCARADLRFPQALLLLPIGTVVIWLTNAARITLLIAIGTWGSPTVALGGFHSLAGWLAFLSVALGTIAVSQRLRWFASSLPSEKDGNPMVPYLLPLMALLATTLITGAFSDGFDWLYPVRLLAVGATLWCLRGSYTRFTWGWSWSAVIIGVAVFGLWLGLEYALAPSGNDEALATALAGLSPGLAAVWLVCRVLGSVVTVPIAEELAFRGYLNRRLIDADFESVPFTRWTWFSLIVSSAVFGVLHDRWLAGTLAGILYALLLSRRGRLCDAVLAHAITNALIAIYVLTTGTWSLW
jgi:exosortase E/protease (VPEID-CTERM system)